MQRGTHSRGIQVKQGDKGGHDVEAKQSRSKVLRRDDQRVGIDFTGRGGVVSPLTITPAGVDTTATALPRLAWTSGQPIVRPATGPVLTKVKPKRQRQPRYVPRTPWSDSTAALMTERSAVCM